MSSYTFEDYLVRLSNLRDTLFDKLPEGIQKYISRQQSNIGTCWIWEGNLNKAVPVVRLEGEKVLVSTYMIKLFGGNFKPCPVKRMCKNNRCVYPWHFRLTKYSRFCINGHLRTVNNSFTRANGTVICRICQAKQEKLRRENRKIR